MKYYKVIKTSVHWKKRRIGTIIPAEFNNDGCIRAEEACEDCKGYNTELVTELDGCLIGLVGNGFLEEITENELDPYLFETLRAVETA